MHKSQPKAATEVSNLSKNVDFLGYQRKLQNIIAIHNASKGKTLFVFCLAVIFSFILWSYYASVEEVVYGKGFFVQNQNNKVQSKSTIEGEITEVLVSEGALVSKGEKILVIQRDLSSSNGAYSKDYYKTLATVTRLEAEAENIPLIFPDALKPYNDYINKEINLFENKRHDLNETLQELKKQEDDARYELTQLQERHKNLQHSYELALKELNISIQKVANGNLSQQDLVSVEKKANNIFARLQETDNHIPKALSILQNKQRLTQEAITAFQQASLTELNNAKAKLKKLEKSTSSIQNATQFALAPGNGMVKKIYVKAKDHVQLGTELFAYQPINVQQLQVEVPEKYLSKIDVGQDAMIKSNFPYYLKPYQNYRAIVSKVNSDKSVTKEGENLIFFEVESENLPLFNLYGSEDFFLRKFDVGVFIGRKSVFSYLVDPIKQLKSFLLSQTTDEIKKA